MTQGTSPEEMELARAGPGRKGEVLRWVNRLGPLIGLVLVYGFFAVIGPKSFSSANSLETMARQTVIVGIGAIGMTVVMICGGIDLSIGSVVAVSGVVAARLLRDYECTALGAAGVGILASVLCGLLTGVLITRLKVVPFIITLGMMLVVRGAVIGVGQEGKVSAPETWLNELTMSVADELSWMVLPPGVWLVIILAILVGAMLRYTCLGRHVFAVGSNELTARLCGVPVDRVKTIAYTLNGFFAGVAGIMWFSYVGGQVELNAADGLELQVIAAVVIGGGSLAGGEGSVFGTLMGAMIMTVIEAGCTQMDLSKWVQKIVAGVIIVVAVTLDRLRHRRAG